MTKTYYAIQTYTSSGLSGVDLGWRNNFYKYDDLATASREYRKVLISRPDHDIRLVKAFFCQNNQKQIVKEVLEFKEAPKR